MNAWQRSRQSLLLFLAARDRRERYLLAGAAAVLVLGLVYALLIDPALGGRAQLRKSLPELRQQVAQLQALAQEAQAASGQAATPVTPVTRESIEASLERGGLKAQNLVLTGDFVKLQLSAAPFAAIANWLDGLRASARVAVSEASISALDEPGIVNATLTLRQQRTETGRNE